jgi:hypothetical protein
MFELLAADRVELLANAKVAQLLIEILLWHCLPPRIVAERTAAAD